MGFLAEVKQRKIYFRRVRISDSFYYSLFIEDWTLFGTIDSEFIKIPVFYWNNVMEPRGFVTYTQNEDKRYGFSELPDLVKFMLCLYLDGAGASEATFSGAVGNRSLTGYQLGEDELQILNSVVLIFRSDIDDVLRPDEEQYGKDAGFALARYDVKDSEFNGNPYRYIRSLHMGLDFLINKEDTLTDQEIDFVKNYQRYITGIDLELVQLLNLRIIAEEKRSNFLSETFGFEDSYTLLEFNDRVVQAIRDAIDDNDPAGFPIRTSHKLQWFENLAPLYGTAGLTSGVAGGAIGGGGSAASAAIATGASTVGSLAVAGGAAGVVIGLGLAYALGYDGGWVFTLGSKEPLVFSDIAVGPIDDPEGNGELLPIDVKRRVGLQKAFPENQDQYQTLYSTIYGIPEGLGVPINPDNPQYFAGTGPTGTPAVPTTDLRDSVFYERPTSFDEITIYKRDFTEAAWEWLSSSGGARGEWLEKFRAGQSQDVLRPDDIVFDYYTQFISAIQDDIEEDGRLNELTVGDRFVGFAKACALYILPELVEYRESLFRYNLLRVYAEADANLEEVPTFKDALDKAAEATNKELRGLDTTDLFEDPEIDEDEIEKRQKAFKQCVLLMNADILQKEYAKKTKADFLAKHEWHQNGLYNKRFVMGVDMAENSREHQHRSINKLLAPGGEELRPFLNMTSDIHAMLQPKIRLFKVFYDQVNKGYLTQEIPFPQHPDPIRIDNMSNGTVFDRGDGVGIKSFEFSFDGENPATATRFIKAKLSLFFQNFQEFVTLRRDSKDREFRYLDLFVNSKFCPRSGENTFSPLYYDPSFYRLRADVGWQIRDDIAMQEVLSKRGTTLAEFNKALQLMNKTFYLNLVDHNINIGKDGTVSVDADYIAYIEGTLRSRQMNALITREAKDLQDKYVIEFERLISEKICDEDQIAELKNAINGIQVQIKKSIHKKFIETLLINGKVYSVVCDKFDINDYRNKDFFVKKPKLLSIQKQEGNNAQQDEQLVQQAEGFQPPDGDGSIEANWSYITKQYIKTDDEADKTRINFFYMADLVYLLLDSIYNENGTFRPEVENTKLLLSSFVLNTPFEPLSILMNFGEIPIDIQTFSSWYEDTILNKDISAISIIDFIRRFSMYLIRRVFADTCINQNQMKKLVFQTSSILAIKDGQGGDPLYNMWSEYKDNSPESPFHSLSMNRAHRDGLLPLKTGVANSTETNLSDFMNYLVIFTHYRPKTHPGRGIRRLDEQDGIYHMFVGADKGLTKEIQFSKVDLQYAREARMATQGTNSLLQLSAVYRSSLKMVGNTLFYPGMELFINPFGLGGPEFGMPYDGPAINTQSPNLSYIMGLGGYQMVLKVNSTINPGKFETTVDAIFVYSGDSSGLTDAVAKQNTLCNIEEESLAAEKPSQSCRRIIIDIENDLIELGQTGTLQNEEPTENTTDLETEPQDIEPQTSELDELDELDAITSNQ